MIAQPALVGIYTALADAHYEYAVEAARKGHVHEVWEHIQAQRAAEIKARRYGK